MTKKPSKRRAKSKSAPKLRGLTTIKTRSRSRETTQSKRESQDSFDKFVDAAVLMLDLPLDPAWRPAVKFNLQTILQHAALLAEFELPDEAEPAPVFRA